MWSQICAKFLIPGLNFLWEHTCLAVARSLFEFDRTRESSSSMMTFFGLSLIYSTCFLARCAFTQQETTLARSMNLDIVTPDLLRQEIHSTPACTLTQPGKLAWPYCATPGRNSTSHIAFSWAILRCVWMKRPAHNIFCRNGTIGRDGQTLCPSF